MTQITKKELNQIYNSSRSGGILKIKKLYIDGKLNILNNIQGSDLREKVFKFLFPEKSKGCCICGKQTTFLSIKKGYRLTCSKSCAMKMRWSETSKEQEDERQRKRIKTNLKKYGVKDPMQTKEIAIKITKSAKNRTQEKRNEIINKRKQTNLKKYGVEFAQKLEQTQTKIKNTCLKKYGVENPSQVEEFKEKRKKTHIEKYGVENAFQAEEIKKKIKQTNLKKYGVENPSQCPEIAEKKVKTHRKHFGVDYPSQHPDTFHLQQKNATASAFKKKDYKLPSGKIIKLQGSEPTAMQYLLKSYSENDILFSKNVPVFDYFDTKRNKKRRYYPDFFIPQENLIIEVKSTYTFEKDFETNMCKGKKVKKDGYNFKFIITDKTKIIEKKI